MSTPRLNYSQETTPGPSCVVERELELELELELESAGLGPLGFQPRGVALPPLLIHCGRVASLLLRRGIELLEQVA